MAFLSYSTLFDLRSVVHTSLPLFSSQRLLLPPLHTASACARATRQSLVHLMLCQTEHVHSCDKMDVVKKPQGSRRESDTTFTSSKYAETTASKAPIQENNAAAFQIAEPNITALAQWRQALPLTFYVSTISVQTSLYYGLQWI